MESLKPEIIQPLKIRGMAENEIVLRASELVDVALEFRRRLEFMRSHVNVVWSVIVEIERVVQESTTIDPFTRSTLLRLCSTKSRTGIVSNGERGLIVPDGGPAGDPST